MKILLLLAVLVAVDARATTGTCKVSEWSQWSEWQTSTDDKDVTSYPAGDKEGWGRENMLKIRKHKHEISEQHRKCKEEGTCPELVSSSGIQPPAPCINGNAETGDRTYPCLNIDMRALVEFSQLGFSGARGNDCWGWTDPTTGNEIAIMGTSDGSSFVDITNPENPNVIGWLPTASTNSDWRDMKVIGDVVYIVSEAAGHGIQVFDLTRLRTETGEFNQDSNYQGVGSCHNIIANEATNRLFAVGCSGVDSGLVGCGGSNNRGGLHIVDVSDPLNPTFDGCFEDDGYVHDAQCVIYTGPDTFYSNAEICFCFNEETFTIVDINFGEIVSRQGYGGVGYTHQGWITEDQTVALMDDELDEMNGSGSTRTYIWDIRDLDNPILETVHNAGRQSIDHNQYIIGDLTYQANYESGLRMLRIDQEAFTLEDVAFFDVKPGFTDVDFFGSWSVYPYFSSGNVIVSSIEYGLFVLTPNVTPNDGKIHEQVVERSRYRSILEAGSNCPIQDEVEYA